MDTIVRIANKTENFSIISNEVAKRLDLSARAKGLYYYLMTLPKDWKVHKNEIYSHFTEGRDAMNKAFDELLNAGYIEKQETREKGKFSKVDYTVYEETATGKPDTEKPFTVNPQLLSTNSTNNLLSKDKKKEKAKALPTSKPTNRNSKEWYEWKDNAESLRMIKQWTNEDIVKHNNNTYGYDDKEYIFTPAELGYIKIMIDLFRDDDDNFDKARFGNRWDNYMKRKEDKPKTISTLYYRINEL